MQRNRVNAYYDEDTSTWQDRFHLLKGSEFYCEVDMEFMTDRFNLTGMNQQFINFQMILDFITDDFERYYKKIEDGTLAKDLVPRLEVAAKKLYGLIHARFIITPRGLLKMADKFRKGDFGRCPRVSCNQGPVVPIGENNTIDTHRVKVYCPGCEDIYRPRSTRASELDGSHFGPTFPYFFFLTYPHFKTAPKVDVYEPKIFGFRLHACANLTRKQIKFMSKKLKKEALEKYGGFLTEEDQNRFAGLEEI